MHPLEELLRRVADSGPEPWYPSLYAQAAGIARDRIDPYLDQLRMGGLIRLTDWVQGRGQGYALTPEGREVLHNPRYLARLVADGEVPRLDYLEAELEPLAERARPVHGRSEVIREALTGPAIPAVTFALIFVNVVWFLAGFKVCADLGVPRDVYWEGAGGRRFNLVLEKLGGMDLDLKYIYQDHQWWRLLTCCFLHIGWMHIGVNMLSLYWIGPLLERMWGSWRFLLLYLISGLVGSAATVVYGRAGVGASGAIWGILATMVTWVLLNRHYLPQGLASRWIGQLVFIFFINIVFTLSLTFISKEAHFGGGLAGLVAAVPMYYTLYGPAWQRVVAALIFAGSLLAGAAWFVTFVLHHVA
jgi:rhomboid protease GluP